MTTDAPKASPPPFPVARLSGARPKECAQFDFLLGDWDARTTRYAPDGSVALALDGHWHAEHRAGGRILLDEFRAWGPDGATWVHFVTLRTWCPPTQRWEMTFLGAHQPFALSRFCGEQRDGEIHPEAAGRDASGCEGISRVRFHDIARDAFRWEQQLSFDAGRSWVRGSSIRARRRASGYRGSRF